MYPIEHKTLPHPTIIKKMRTFLEIEGKMGLIPQPTSSQYRPPQPDTNPNVRKDKAMGKRKRAAPTKKFRLNTASRPSDTATCPSTTISKAPNNAKPQAYASENRPPPLEDAPVHKSTPWPSAGKMSGNLFKERKDCLLPPNYLNNDNKDITSVTSPKPPIKEEPKIGEQSIISLRTEKCGWGPNCPFCKNQDKEEDWDGNHQKQPPQQKIQMPQARHSQTLIYQNSQKPNKKTQIDQYLSQTTIHKQWEAEMEKLNAKYNLNCFSDSELDSESDEGEQYKYEHGYETLI